MNAWFPSANVGPFLYQYGESEGDARVPVEDNGYSPPVNLSQPFPFLGYVEDVLFVRDILVLVGR